MNDRPDIFRHAQTTRLALTLLTIALLALRKSDSLLNPQFWAEDGALFFIEAERHGGWGLLFHPYEGYLHLLPRLIAALGTSVPLLHVPAFYAWTSLAVTGIVAWCLQSPRLRLPCGWVAALALALVPHTGEVYLTACNLQWITALALFGLALSRDATSPLGQIGDFALLVFTGLSGPFILLALPLFAWRGVTLRSRASLGLLAAAFACAAAHVPALLARATPDDQPPWAPFHHLAVVGRRWIGSLFLGPYSPGEIPFALLTLVGVPVLAWALWRRRKQTVGGLPLLLTAVLVLAAASYKVRPDTWTLSELGNGDRYFFIPKIILLWLLASLATTFSTRARISLGAVLLLPLVVNAPRFFIPPAPDQNWKNSCALIEQGEPVSVPILPAPDTTILHPGRRPLR